MTQSCKHNYMILLFKVSRAVKNKEIIYEVEIVHL